MVSRRLERFRKLEAERRPPSPVPPLPTPPGAQSPPRPPSEPAANAAAMSRFAGGNEGDAPLRLRQDDGGQPFVRCCHCRMDSFVSAKRCGGCDADLTTHDQRAFNEAFWRQKIEEDLAERREVDRLTAAQHLVKSDYAQAQRELARWQSGAIPGLRSAEVFGDLGPRAERVIARSLVVAARLGPALGAAMALNLAALVLMLVLRIGFLPWLFLVGCELVVFGLFWGRLTRP